MFKVMYRRNFFVVSAQCAHTDPKFDSGLVEVPKPFITITTEPGQSLLPIRTQYDSGTIQHIYFSVFMDVNNYPSASTALFYLRWDFLQEHPNERKTNSLSLASKSKCYETSFCLPE